MVLHFFLEVAFHCAFHLYVSIKIVLHAGMTALREHFEQSFYRFRAVNLCIEGRVLLDNEMVESGMLSHIVRQIRSQTTYLLNSKRHNAVL